jgi:pyruvate/2-oxoglutarate dehydrogenase complex dihydrolipoamide dehydrogenase (E3) component
MSALEHFDVLILGSGQGGKLLAWDVARAGRKVAVVERQWIGGSCPAVACMPSKNDIWGARVAHLAQNAAHFGTLTGPVRVDMARVWRRKQDMIERETALHLNAYKESGADLIMGTGRFVAEKTIEVWLNDGGTRLVRGEQVVVNVGSHAAIPDIPGIEVAGPLTHIDVLELDYLPEHLLVLGGGYVGVEMAQAFGRFGSRVTIIQPGRQLMGREDPDVAEEMERILRNEGVQVELNCEPIGVQGRSGEQVAIKLQMTSGERTIKGSHLLAAVGRVPNTAGVGLDNASIEIDERGYIRVNDRLQTSAPGVWAIGECAGSPHFTHASVDDFRIVRDNMDGEPRSTAGRLVPHVVFSDPPLAHIGLTEREAQRQGIVVRVARLPMSRVLRTQVTNDTQGFMKALISAKDDRLLGFTMIGSDAGEVMAAIQTAILAELPYQRLRDAAIAHLTVAEGIGPLLTNVPSRRTPN